MQSKSGASQIGFPENRFNLLFKGVIKPSRIRRSHLLSLSTLRQEKRIYDKPETRPEPLIPMGID
ncbi:hypothetical protein [Ectothiorhodospira shaposhnikovii]|uniref:hypothetical protein n=1 Tax=Ectothiorhodospira shaposhnikovii TaxID=1054 RepID=UPI001EE7BD5B|nr:hypothetical protein [Ectothiorhodospira shaposhnikovii]MCG5514422.1 hypothetical protein [Ectothiorhodospira shaposhnikovii]